MGFYLDQYLEASGAGEDARAEFNKIKAALPALSQNPKTAADQVLTTLFEKLSFDYGRWHTAQAVLQNRKGNCVGMPMLTATLLGESGIDAKFKYVTNPIDAIYGAEQRFFRELDENPWLELAEEKTDSPCYRFTPMGHLVLDVDGKLIEATDPSDHSNCDIDLSYESVKPVTFDQAIGLVYHSRAEEAAEEEDYDEACRLLTKSLEAYPQNRILHFRSCYYARMHFDDELFNKSRERFRELTSEDRDSLQHLLNFIVTGDANGIDNALSAYPAYAAAIQAKAGQLLNHDRARDQFSFVHALNESEARHMLAVCSHLFANSEFLPTSHLFAVDPYHLVLTNLFGAETVGRILKNIDDSDSGYGTFDYHLARFEVTKERLQLYEAFDRIRCPRDRVRFLRTAIDLDGCVKEFDNEWVKAEKRKLDRRFGSSRLYLEYKKALNI